MKTSDDSIINRTPVSYANAVLSRKLERDPELLYYRSAQDPEETTFEIRQARCLYAGYNGFLQEFSNFMNRLKRQAWGMPNTKKSFKELEEEILKSSASSEYKQAAIVILREFCFNKVDKK
jgi:hypothetical protein